MSKSSSPRFARQPLLLPEVQLRCRVVPRLFLGLDYDGTLVPMALRSEEARPSSTVLDLLSQLVSLPSMTVAVLSGRPLGELMELLPIPGLTYVGTHGLEIRTSTGNTQRTLPPGAFTSVIACLRREIAARVASCTGVVLEDKRQALALHYQLAPSGKGEQAVAHFLAAVSLYQRRGVKLETVHGKKIIEVRPHGVNKGRALQYLLGQEVKGMVPVYIGDDETDEDAFRVLHSYGVTIVVSDPPRSSAAQYSLRNPQEVVEFLTSLATTRRNRQSA